MSTRGCFGYYKDGVSKLCFNRWDSYPKGLGQSFVDFLVAEGIDTFVASFSFKEEDDATEFIKDSIFCEWAYVANIDSGKLEIYEGFQKQKSENRYQPPEPIRAGYWGPKLIAEIPFESLKEGFETFSLELAVTRDTEP